MAERLYARHQLRRVYYTAYSPVPGQEPLFVGKPTPLVREHRLYQADQLVRNYGFSLNEIVDGEHPDLDLRMDPELAWALRHPEQWPVDVNSAPHEQLLRVPGFGRHTVKRILSSRRRTRLRTEHLRQLGVRLRVARHFIETADAHPATGAGYLDPATLVSTPQQLPLLF